MQTAAAEHSACQEASKHPSEGGSSPSPQLLRLGKGNLLKAAASVLGSGTVACN